jgi:hypothetical protein
MANEDNYFGISFILPAKQQIDRMREKEKKKKKNDFPTYFSALNLKSKIKTINYGFIK